MICRVMRNSIARSGYSNASLYAFRILQETELPAEAEWLKKQKLEEFAPQAIIQALQARHRLEALEIYWSDFYAWRRRLTRGGITRLLQCLSPFRVADAIQARVKS